MIRPLRSLATAVLGLLLATCGGPGEPPPPSILMVSIDTLRPDHLGLYGYGRDTSPYLDRLAEESLVFDRAYTTAAWTLVAHMSMMTGLEPEEHGVTQPKRAVSPQVPMLADRLAAQGYRTVGLFSGECKWIEPRFGFARGFDEYYGYSSMEEAEERLEALLAEHNPDRPLFLFLHIFEVHSAPFRPGFRGFYDTPEPFDTMFIEAARERLAHVDCRRAWDAPEGLPPEEIEAMVALYDGGIRYVDGVLGRWIERWREDGLLDRSTLLITSDHGEALGQRGPIGGHGGMYEEGLRIPLLVRFHDGYRAGERESGVVSVVDYAPTFLELAGLELEPWRSGRSLRAAPDPERVVRAQRALIGSRYKLQMMGDTRRIFDLDQDPDELNSLDPEGELGRDTAGSLRRRYQELRGARAELPGRAIELSELDPESRKALLDLGYAGAFDEE